MVHVISRTSVHPRTRTTPPPGSWGEKYRTGAWEPNSDEIVAENLDVIQGSIPEDISGCYIRNTENPIHDTMDGNINYHPFDGDGMIHMLQLRGGKASYCNKFVRTKAFEMEQKAGRSLWTGILEYRKSKMRSEHEGWGEAMGKMYKLKDTASTDVVVHGGRVITTWYLCGEPYSLSLDSLETQGVVPWTPKEGVSAHCKVDEVTGELLFFNYGMEDQGKSLSPFLNYGEVDANGRLTNYQHIPFVSDPRDGLAMPHDMAFTKQYGILNYFEKAKTWFAIIPRHGNASQVRWFQASPTYTLHWLNAYEEGDHIVLDGYHMAHPETFINMDNLDLQACAPQLWRWRFDLKSGETSEECLDERVVEFGMFNQRHQGRDYRYAYSVIPTRGEFTFSGIRKHNLKTGESSTFDFGPGVFGSEAPVAPKVGAREEDDAYLVSFLTDVPRDRSVAVILDAKRIEAGPVCTILLPHRISSGTHSFWADDTAAAILARPSASKL